MWVGEPDCGLPDVHDQAMQCSMGPLQENQMPLWKSENNYLANMKHIVSVLALIESCDQNEEDCWRDSHGTNGSLFHQ